MMRLFSLATVAVLTFGTTGASAAPLTFFGHDNPRGTLTNSLAAEAQFKAALGVFGTETADTLTPLVWNPTLVFGATGVTATYDAYAYAIGPTAVSAPQALIAETADQFTFNQPVYGFGTFLIGVGAGVFNQHPVIFTLENTVLATTQVVNFGTFGTGFPLNNVMYVGVLDAANPFNRVTVSASELDELFFFDNVTAGFAPASAVPEPASLTLLATGAIGLLARRRQRR